ncbi:M48 family metallopeptidase [Natronoflexus pectinivorans]|uniref:STE24 endopeptidase n=1 Tax=Natronoflexus pectinivorans TaxID=682526 RepID=A0A4R2GKC0_9BACT|nr:M48 family metallopeptidase [Natronoflexus pectinivorans]TCO09222.1 STE24 endopeptidase [Natronoflexus pectinivorans]
MHPLLYIILAIIVFEALWDFFLGELNRKSWSDKVPKCLEDVYPQEKFEKQKQYRLANYRFGLISSAVSTILILMVLLLQGFGWLHYTVESFTNHKYLQPLVYFGAIGLASMILSLPFSIYSTFVIEEKFGFNRTTKGTFIADVFKSLLLGALIGGFLLWLVVWFYHSAGSLFWLYAWGGLSLFMIFFSKFYTTLILPLFNKLTPLEEGDLKSAIENMSQKAGFSLENVFVMDGSKRSTKANAFFSGFGKNKRIVLFDTLINDLDKEEIVAVLAHEIGHYRLKHTIRGTMLGIFQTGITLFLLGWFINHPGISQALGVANPVFHVALLGFGLLYSPISSMAGLGMTILSRKQEYQADEFAANHASASALQSALKKISTTALSNPTPHPWFVFFNYSHPPLLKRLEALDSNDKD